MNIQLDTEKNITDIFKYLMISGQTGRGYCRCYGFIITRNLLSPRISLKYKRERHYECYTSRHFISFEY